MLYLLYLLVSVFLLLIYFKLALKFNILDKPNQRSSHKHLTIRGGGIIFPLLLLIHSLVNGVSYPYFSAGLLIISFISFYDDIRPLSNKIRLLAHLIAVLFLFTETGLNTQPIWIIVISFIFIVGTINAYNFMDGINGLTVSYSLVAVLTLYFVNENILEFVQPGFLIVCSITLLIFGFVNFRTKAKAFAGDVGSVSMAFIITFFLIMLITKSNDIKYIGFLLIYGLDAVSTILFRLIRRENIFKAHRSHFYQYLVNVKSWSHLATSALYTIVQLVINIIILTMGFSFSTFLFFTTVCFIFTIIFRLWFEGRQVLLTNHLASD